MPKFKIFPISNFSQLSQKSNFRFFKKIMDFFQASLNYCVKKYLSLENFGVKIMGEINFGPQLLLVNDDFSDQASIGNFFVY